MPFDIRLVVGDVYKLVFVFMIPVFGLLGFLGAALDSCNLLSRLRGDGDPDEDEDEEEESETGSLFTLFMPLERLDMLDRLARPFALL